MKIKLVVYWIATVLLAAQMVFAACMYLAHQPKMMESFASLGYPAYLPNFLGVAKALGVLVLLMPGQKILKEWAYAGFTFTFLGAAYSHWFSHQEKQVLMPVMALVILAVSYACRPLNRRPVLVA